MSGHWTDMLPPDVIVKHNPASDEYLFAIRTPETEAANFYQVSANETLAHLPGLGAAVAAGTLLNRYARHHQVPSLATRVAEDVARRLAPHVEKYGIYPPVVEQLGRVLVHSEKVIPPELTAGLGVDGRVEILMHAGDRPWPQGFRE